LCGIAVYKIWGGQDKIRFGKEVIDEIRYDLFSKYALECVEENIDINTIASMAKNVNFNRIVPFEEIKNKVI
jgi:hypothetical protein